MQNDASASGTLCSHATLRLNNLAISTMRRHLSRANGPVHAGLSPCNCSSTQSRGSHAVYWQQLPPASRQQLFASYLRRWEAVASARVVARPCRSHIAKKASQAYLEAGPLNKVGAPSLQSSRLTQKSTPTAVSQLCLSYQMLSSAIS